MSLSLDYCLCEQASVVSDLKNWCISKIQSLESRLSGDRSDTKLRRSSSLTDTLSDCDPRSHTAVPDPSGAKACCSPSTNQPEPKDGREAAAASTSPEDGSAGYYVIEVDRVSPGMTLVTGRMSEQSHTHSTAFLSHTHTHTQTSRFSGSSHIQTALHAALMVFLCLFSFR